MTTSAVGLSMLKYCTLLMNIIILISGVILIAIGATGLTNGTVKENPDARPLFIALTVIGSLTTSFSLIGCCGLFTENTFLLYTYTFLAFVGAVLIFALGIVAFVRKNKMVNRMFDEMSEKFKKFEKGTKDDNGRWINTTLTPKDLKEVEKLQSELKCCGWTKPFEQPSVPDSCDCLGIKNNCKNRIYTKPCSAEFKRGLNSSFIAAGWACIIISFFPVIAAVVSSKVASKARDYQQFSE